MANECIGCQFFRVETIEIERVGGSFNTYIDMKNPDDEEGAVFRIAQCSREGNTNDNIERNEDTIWFFGNEIYVNLYPEDQAMAGQNDTCSFYQAIP